ncbi:MULTISPECIES: hypothetical protein [unclassified Arthrobacter]|uniref:hypothetical protein n=1 Tax=unclassified Arthrobacter TaxID=235627 RepID=UPI001E3AA386|nr:MULTISPECIES: hypothetical protein [unclassified Arthrobacter]MCC9144740.1 hypothetical protein [Arthrobacter sp. zg-Y919]MDK1275966.1 hypothetical protein [Arthrobacter sp. zg.Y919]MDM7990173.1 hypothetical protein [Arthrobacter sp. zg-Y877]WIB02682.1 hypothetical protein QNO10_12115 [Arthrobacter sp. zg-Y919]
MTTPENTPEPGPGQNYPTNPTGPLGSGGPMGPGTGPGTGPGARPEPQYGQYAPGPDPYGQQAAQPAYAYQPGAAKPAKGPAPREVITGFWLIIAAGVLSFINNVITSFSLPSLMTSEEQEAFSGVGVDEQSLNSFLVSFGIVVALMGLGVYVLIAFFVRRGKNWARVLGTVFAAFSLIGIFTMLGAYFTSPLSLISLASSLAGIAGIVMLYLKPSNPYFRTAPLYPY